MSYSDEWPAPEDKPFVFIVDMEANGIHGLKTVPLSDYTYLKEWQERAVKHIEELTAWNQASQEGMVQIVKMRQTAEAERDAAHTRLLEVDAAHKQTIRHAEEVTAQRDELRDFLRDAHDQHADDSRYMADLADERDAAVARAERAESELEKMRRSPGWHP